MSGFDDLFGQSYEPRYNETADAHVIGTTLWIDATITDGDDATINLATGYTASLTPYVNKNTALSTFTQSLSGGRQILLSSGASTGYNLVVTATPAASLAMFAPYPGKSVKVNLILTRTSDGKSTPLWVGCNIPLRPKLA